MKEVKLTRSYLDDFLLNLRYQDYLELKICYKDSLDEFYEICLDEKFETYFLVDDNNVPLALGGAFCLNDENYKVARLWLLATNEIINNKFLFYKYLKSKILFFKNKYEVLFNYIYKTNFDSLKLLKKHYFKVVDLANQDYKLFYFYKGENNFDIRYFAGK